MGGAGFLRFCAKFCIMYDLLHITYYILQHTNYKTATRHGVERCRELGAWGHLHPIQCINWFFARLGLALR